MNFDLLSNPLIGMIHLPRLTFDTEFNIEQIVQYAITEAKKLESLDYSGIMVENFNDSPFVKSRVDDIVFARMILVMSALKKFVKIPVGVNILRNASVQALTIATTLELPFIRSNIYEGAYITDQGIIEGVANEIISYKYKIRSKVKILADIHVKHAYQMGNFSILESAENAILRGKADAVIVSGISTGREPDVEPIKELANHDFRPIIGSGLTIENMNKYEGIISGAIVGTSIKKGDNVLNEIDHDKAESLINKWNNIF